MISPDMVPLNSRDKVTSAIRSATASAVRLWSNLNLTEIRLAASAIPISKNSIGCPLCVFSSACSRLCYVLLGIMIETDTTHYTVVVRLN